MKLLTWINSRTSDLRIKPQGRFRRQDSGISGSAFCLFPVTFTTLHLHTEGIPQDICLRLCCPAVLTHDTDDPDRICMDISVLYILIRPHLHVHNLLSRKYRNDDELRVFSSVPETIAQCRGVISQIPTVPFMQFLCLDTVTEHIKQKTRLLYSYNLYKLRQHLLLHHPGKKSGKSW